MPPPMHAARVIRGHANVRVFCALAILVASMGGLAYASVPLYELFCQVTGYGGTTRVAASPSGAAVNHTVTVRFDASVNGELGWSFSPVQRAVTVRAGENVLAFYKAENTGDETVVGTATFNVSPDKAGIYFNKVECFCFTEQVLRPGERVNMPVSFFIDPEMAKDRNLQDVTTITLSYTFFRATDQGRATAVEQARASSVGDTNTMDQMTN